MSTPIKKVKVVKRKSNTLPKPTFVLAEDLSDINNIASITLVSNNNNRNQVFTCDLRQLPYCCGVYEIGNIDRTDRYAFKGKENEAISILADGLNKLLNNCTDKNGTITFITNIVPLYTDDCAFFKKVLIKSGSFVFVKTFRNKGSRNIIEMWISNN